MTVPKDALDLAYKRILDRNTPGPEISEAWKVIGQLPHCDCFVLHGPTRGCEYCNDRADLQAYRVEYGINFTGENDDDKVPCPSQKIRDLDTIEQWPGNRPGGK